MSYRLMSGLRASISTHIAREYFFDSSQRWGRNLDLYARTVGAYPERVNNLYFTFLFLLRALARSTDMLLAFDYSTGNKTEDALTHMQLQRLLIQSTDNDPNYDCRPVDGPYQVLAMVEECKNGFDESSLFMDVGENDNANWLEQAEKFKLLDDFRSKFRNITRIMDCVACEKCRLWGKLQILGMGPAAKVLLSRQVDRLSRQEVIALVNVVHQVGRSVVFASEASEKELELRLSEAGAFLLSVFVVAAIIVTALAMRHRTKNANKIKASL